MQSALPTSQHLKRQMNMRKFQLQHCSMTPVSVSSMRSITSIHQQTSWHKTLTCVCLCLKPNRCQCRPQEWSLQAFFFWSAPIGFRLVTTLRLTCGPAGNRTATGSLSATSRKERRPTNYSTGTPKNGLSRLCTAQLWKIPWFLPRHFSEIQTSS